LDAALRVFSERGYHAAAISELNEAMGLASGSIYKAFKDKRGITAGVIRLNRPRALNSLTLPMIRTITHAGFAAGDGRLQRLCETVRWVR
ncbi:TetR family transcriptional regulator, partial [Rhizobium leguminosarum]|uniref:helix-turn-helix domain-containing protein n=1 Tax=Rhizobium leguminosarum TaxID=384 RepID=UPI003F9B8428